MLPSPWLEALLARYGWIFIGLTFGLAAKYALLIKRGVPIRFRLLLADILLLPMVGLIAYWLATRGGIDGEPRALLTGLCMVGGDRLVKLLTEKFFQQVDAELEAVAAKKLGEMRQVVQAELSGSALVEDAMSGRAPEEFAALKPHPQAKPTLPKA